MANPAARRSKSATRGTQLRSKSRTADAADTLKVGRTSCFADQQPTTIAKVVFNKKPFAAGSDKNRERRASSYVPTGL